MAEPFSLLQELGLEPSAVRQPFGVLHGCVVTEPHVSAAGEHSRLISELVTPRSDQTVEGSSPATVKVTGLTPA